MSKFKKIKFYFLSFCIYMQSNIFYLQASTNSNCKTREMTLKANDKFRMRIKNKDVQDNIRSSLVKSYLESLGFLDVNNQDSAINKTNKLRDAGVNDSCNNSLLGQQELTQKAIGLTLYGDDTKEDGRSISTNKGQAEEILGYASTGIGALQTMLQGIIVDSSTKGTCSITSATMAVMTAGSVMTFGFTIGSMINDWLKTKALVEKVRLALTKETKGSDDKITEHQGIDHAKFYDFVLEQKEIESERAILGYLNAIIGLVISVIALGMAVMEVYLNSGGTCT